MTRFQNNGVLLSQCSRLAHGIVTCVTPFASTQQIRLAQPSKQPQNLVIHAAATRADAMPSPCITVMDIPTAVALLASSYQQLSQSHSYGILDHNSRVTTFRRLLRSERRDPSQEPSKSVRLDPTPPPTKTFCQA